MSRKRTLGFSLALVAVFTAGFFFPHDVDLSRSFRNPYPLIDPTRSIVAQEHFFSTIEPLRKRLKEIAARYEKEGNRVGLYFEFLNTGSNVSINQESRFWPASLTKMPTAMAAMKKVEKGDWKLSNELVLFAEDKDDRFGDLYKKPVGTRFTIEELVKSILTDSDNTAHRILVRNLSSDDYTDIFEAIGLENLFDKEYNITAKEYSRIPRALYAASYLNREHSEMVLLWLAQSPFDEFLGQGVPDGVVFPHKIGEEGAEHVYLDSGIVYVPDRPYLVTVMIESKGVKGKGVAERVMKEVSDASYVYVSEN
jgi:beta-lactamase class A